MSTEDKNKYKGIGGTVLFHGLLLVLFLFFGFRTPLPLPEEQGIAINFGTSDEGMGDVQPDQPADNQVNKEQAAASSAAPNSSSDQNVATQDVEEAPAVRPVTKTPERSKPVTEPTKPAEAPVEDVKSKVDSRALYPGKGTGSSGGSQGETGKPGDQGKVDGSKDTNKQGDGSTGGLTGSPDFNMVGRTLTKKPIISDQSQTQGTVVVTVTVNRRGEVISAKVKGQVSSINDSDILKKCLDAARQARFSSSDDEEQTGTISFIFKLQ